MYKKNNYRLLIPDTTFDKVSDVEDMVNQLLDYYVYIQDLDGADLSDTEKLNTNLDKLSAEFNELSQVYGKLMQEYGVLNFQGSELFTRNTITGLKLGLLMHKLERARSIWGNQLNLDYETAKEIIQHFANRYLMKKNEADE
ncbi:MAG: hypothetical protein H7641_01965 [Candidatus Heimdallarchaeota archaeon]|nr:hypothetical protein [Candidatus Heimdallarchaeota archaeon]MCK4876329.1 hypothetical protein [Candidatus Heimdallarchaeota archaeon]